MESGKVSTRENGEALDPDQVSEWFRRLTRDAGLPPVRFHDLRHGAASVMLASGSPMKEVQEVLGHAAMALTADTYSSVFDEVSSESAAAAEASVPRTVGTAGSTLVPHDGGS